MARLLLTGATGTTGLQLLRHLLAREIKLRVLSRDPDKAKAAFAALPGSHLVEICQGDFSNPVTWAPAFQGIEKVFLLAMSTVGRDQVATEGRFAAKAKECGVRHLVKVSMFAADINDPTSSLTRWHAEAERAIEATGIAFTFLRPNLFMQNLLRDDLSAIKSGFLYRCVGEARISHYDARDLAEVVALILLHRGQEHLWATYELTGPQALTYAQVAEQLSRVTAHPVKAVELSDGAMASHWRHAGMPPAVITTMLQMYQCYRKGRGAAVIDNTEVLLGRPARGLQQFVSDHRDKLL